MMTRERRSQESPAADTEIDHTAGHRVAGYGDPNAAALLSLQASGGNQMVARLLSSGSARNAPGGELSDRIRAQLGRGEPLPDDLRTHAEADLGQSLGPVQLHRDSGAASMASELGARAFTTGQDVFFGSGAYDPVSASGYHVLAHELAHTVQQSAGPVAATPVAPGLAVSEPGDRDEDSAEQAARNAVRHRTGAGPETPVQRSATNSSTPEPIVLQRYTESAAVPAMGSGSGDSTVNIGPLFGEISAVTATGPSPADSSAYVPFSTRIETHNLSDGVTGGVVTFHVFESVLVNNMVMDDRQWGSWDGNVPYTVTGGQVTFGGPIVQADFHGSGATAAVSVGSGVTPGGGYVTFTVTIASSGSQTTGGSIGVGPISGSAPVSGTTNFAGGLARTFTVNLRPTPAQPITAPDVSFQIGSSALEDGQEGTISRWFQALPPAAQDAIRNGRRNITISGYASTTGRRHRNRDLSEQRAHVVERILRGFAGSAANITIFFFGEDQAPTADETEDPTWRRATVVVQVPNRTSPQAPGPAGP